MALFQRLGTLRDNARLIPLLAMIACMMVGNGLVSPILSLYARTFGVASTLVGMLVTVFGVGRLVMNLPAGYLSQRIGRRPLLIGGALTVAASGAAAALTDSFAMLLVWRFVQGIGSGIYMTASLAALADLSTPRMRATNLSLYQAAQQLGASLGPAVGGFVAFGFGYAAPFWVYAGVGLLAAGVGIFAFQDTLETGTASKPLASSASRAGLMTLPFFAICVLTCAAFLTRVVTLFQIIPQLGEERFQLSVGTIGGALTLSAFMNFLVLPFTPGLIERFGTRMVVLGSTTVTVLGLVILYTATSLAWFWVAVVALGAAGGVGFPAISAFTISCLPRNRYGPGMGMQRTFGDIGFVFGPVFAGFLDDATGSKTADIMMNIALQIGAVTFFLVASRGFRPRPVLP